MTHEHGQSPPRHNDNGQQIDPTRNILFEIAEDTRARIAAQRQTLSLAALKERACATTNPKGAFAFEAALRAQGMSFICEVKKASPSKGLIAKDFPYVSIAKDYEAAGASAISCLTEPHYFEGSNDYLAAITAAVSLPVLKKDFFVDEYMLYEAKYYGADAVLLICALLDDATLARFFALAQSLGLSAVFEAHDASEIERALACGARIIGVNNRNLKTFALSLQTSITLRALVPPDILFISESGIQTAEDIALLQAHAVDAVLVGESLMRAENKKEMLDSLKGAKRKGQACV